MKTVINYDEMTVAEIVTKNIRTADVFKENGIDFCCGGHVLVKDVCKKKKVDFDQLIEDIANLDTAAPEHNYDSWKLDFLVDYIINTHHKYVTTSNELILQYSNKVAKVHGHHYSEVIEINTLLEAIVQELNAHLQKEEMILFPYIKQLVLMENGTIPKSTPPFETIQNPINMLETEHENAGDIMKKISELSNNFTPPESACNTFRALYAKLEEYQNDLFQHIHLENNILFPKAIKLEQSFK